MESLDSTKEQPKKKKPRELLNLDVREVSLVDRPAIRREFLVVKRDETTNKDTIMSDELDNIDTANIAKEDIVPLTEAEPAPALFSESDFNFDGETSETSEIEKMLSPALVKILLAAARGLKGEGDTYKGAEKGKVDNAAKLIEELVRISSETQSKAESEDGSDENLDDDDEEKSKQNKKLKKVETKMTEKNAPVPVPVSLNKREDGTYDLAGVPDEMQATIQEVCKQHDAAIQKAAQLEEVLKAERDERLRRDYVEKASKEFLRLPGTPVETGLLLKSLHDLDKDVAEKVESIFKTVNAQLENSSMLNEVGSPAVQAETTAWGRIEKQAAELIASGAVTNKAAGVSKVLEMNPKLYQDYLQEGGN